MHESHLHVRINALKLIIVHEVCRELHASSSMCSKIPDTPLQYYCAILQIYSQHAECMHARHFSKELIVETLTMHGVVNIAIRLGIHVA